MPRTVTKPSKQRKMLYQAPAHRLRKFLSAPLSKDLRKSHDRHSFPVRKGDTVKIVRGDFAGIEGKVSKIDVHNQRIFVEGVSRERVAGTSTNVSVHASKVLVTKLNLDDKWRSDSLKLVEAKRPIEKET